MVVKVKKLNEFEKDELLALARLLQSIWSPEDMHLSDEKTIEKFVNCQENKKTAEFTYVVDDDGAVIGASSAFERTLFCNNKPLKVIAISGLCVTPDRRGKRVAIKIIAAQIKAIKKCNGLALFQTDKPNYYLKLNARLVTNRFFNSKDPDNPQKRPWDSKYVLFFPGDYDWPTGDIDICGSSF